MTKTHHIVLLGLLPLSLAMSLPHQAWAVYSNPQSVLVGDQAAGMGGAYTAMVGDAAGGAFYNPATLSRMTGNTLSASINVYHKYDTQFTEGDQLNEAALRINRGSIMPIPSSSGTVHTFGNFAFGLSIVLPDFDSFNGPIFSDSTTTSYLNLRDESLWVGGAWALNLDQRQSVGLTMYYTSRSLSRSITDQTNSGGVSTVTNEEKTLSHNAVLYQVGYFLQLTERLSLGASYRFASLPISGTANYFSSQISTGGSLVTPTTLTGVTADTRVPPRLNLGLSYRLPKWVLALDMHWHGRESYIDVPGTPAAEKVEHLDTVNVSLGGEYAWKSWLSVRAGVFTNKSTHPTIAPNPSVRQGDHVDMWGFATNFAFHTSSTTSVTLGGYYSGGRGQSVQQVGQDLAVMPKNHSIFSFLVGTSYWF